MENYTTGCHPEPGDNRARDHTSADDIDAVRGIATLPAV
jgi:hypothetical protein